MTRLSGNTYSIGSPTRICAATGKALAEGDSYVAVLAQPRDRDEFVRLDFGREAWDGGARPGDGLVVLGHWRGTVGAVDAKRRLLVDDESLLELFERSGEEADASGPGGEGGGGGEAARLAFRFVLALILLRKRLLIQEGSRGGTLLVRPRGVPKPPEGPALVEVEDPGMSEELTAQVTDRLRAVLADSGSTAPAPGGKGGAA